MMEIGEKLCGTFTLCSALALAGVAAAAPRVDLSAYGAKCDGVSDDTAAVNAAVSAAQGGGAAIYIPAGQGCLYSNTITLTKLIGIYGDGASTSKMIYTGAGNGITIVPPVKDGTLNYNRGHRLHGFRILATNPASAIGIHVYLPAGSAYAYFDYSDLIVEGFGTLGLALENSTPANVDGIFNGRILNSLVFNGIKGVNLGDSIIFDGVTASGKNNVLLGGLSGARQLAFLNGSISTTSGALVLNGVHGFRARNVWIEAQGPCPSGCSAAVTISNSFDAYLEGLTFNNQYVVNGIAGTAYDNSIQLNGATDAKIINNNFGNAGRLNDIYIGPGGGSPSARTRIEGNVYSSGGEQPRVAKVSYAPGSN